MAITNLMRAFTAGLSRLWQQKTISNTRLLCYFAVAFLLSLVVITSYENRQVEMVDIAEYAKQLSDDAQVYPGSYQAAAYAAVTENLISKPGGIISNDVFFPGVWLDDMPNWELGVVSYLRQMLQGFAEQPDASKQYGKGYPQALELLSTPLSAWPFPSSQAAYESALAIFKDEFKHINGLSASASMTEQNNDLQLRAIRSWLSEVSVSLEKYNNLLLASASDHSVLSDVVSYQASEPLNLLDGKTEDITRLHESATVSTTISTATAAKALEGAAASSEAEDTNLTEKESQAAEINPKNTFTQTSWLHIDDVFFQSRGYVWALLHFLQALEKDHPELLKSKAKQAALQIVIEELTAAQEPLWSPMVLNGKGMGVLANHSLVLASHIEAAQEALQRFYQHL